MARRDGNGWFGGAARGVMVGVVLALSGGVAWPTPAPTPKRGRTEDGTYECKFLYEHADGIYLDVGSEVGLARGRLGWLFKDGRRVARVQVIEATTRSSFLRVLSARPEKFARVQDMLTLTVDPVAPEPDDAPPTEEVQPGRQELEVIPVTPVGGDGAPAPAGTGAGEAPGGEAPGGAPSRPSTLKDPGGTELPPIGDSPDDAFRPLLAPQSEIGIPEPRNLAQGRVTLSQELQKSSQSGLDFQRTRLRAGGSVERLGATPWALEWDGDLILRSGRGLADVDGYEELRLQMYRLAFSRRFDDRSFLRIGRFVPRELPAVGYVDGLQYEEVLSDHWRVGGITGFRPDRDDLKLAFDEYSVTPYLTYFDATGNDQYSATVGVLGTYYEGGFDRLALLADQSLYRGDLFVDLSTEIDFDVGNFESRDGVRLTRANLAASYLMEGWTPRASVDRWETLDIEAERDLVEVFFLNEDDFFQDDWWRYSVGASHKLGGGFVLDEEVSFTQSDYDDVFHWQVGMSKNGVFGMPAASSTLTVYNLSGGPQDGYAARLSGWFPLPRRDLTLQPWVTYRWVDFDLGGSTYEYADVSLSLHWRPKHAWEVFGNVSVSLSDAESRVYGQLGLTWRF